MTNANKLWLTECERTCRRQRRRWRQQRQRRRQRRQRRWRRQTYIRRQTFGSWMKWKKRRDVKRKSGLFLFHKSLDGAVVEFTISILSSWVWTLARKKLLYLFRNYLVLSVKKWHAHVKAQLRRKSKHRDVKQTKVLFITWAVNLMRPRNQEKILHVLDSNPDLLICPRQKLFKLQSNTRKKHVLNFFLQWHTSA